ncbi:MAG: glycosyltransferase [Elusimicrobiota bacterium]|nr:glycosyltransferase [Elusimicrobiota bacterium]
MANSILINSFFSGGAERQAALLISKIKFDKVLTLENQKNFAVDFEDINPLSNHNQDTSSVYKTLFLPLYAKKLSPYIKPKDTVLSFMERANFVNLIAKRNTHHRVIIAERTQPSKEFTGIKALLIKPLIKKLYPKADMIIANSKGVKNDLIENFQIPEEKIKIIDNSYDIDAILEKTKETLTEGEEKIFNHSVMINVGRLTPQKGQKHLIRIFSKIKKSKKNLKLVFIGEGEIKGELINLAGQKKLKVFDIKAGTEINENYDIYFLDFKENTHKYVARASLFVFTSIWEGFPNAIMETLISGTPIICADCPSGPREILAPDTDFHKKTNMPEFAEYGILMPAFSNPDTQNSSLEDVWIANIDHILSSPLTKEKYSNKGLQRVKNLEIDKTIEKWQNLLQNIETKKTESNNHGDFA